MKTIKRFCILLAVIMALTTQTVSAYTTSPEDVVYFDDGSYMMVTLLINESRSGNSKTASKTFTYYDTFGVEQWAVTLYATFTYDGTEYWTTDCSITAEILNDNWHLVSKSATMSGCGATGEFTMCKKALGITTKTVFDTITLSCSPYGVIS